MTKTKTSSTLAEMMQDIMECPFIEKVEIDKDIPNRPEQTKDQYNPKEADF